MGFSAINLRSTNERQEGFEFGAVPMTHFDIDLIDRILQIKNKKKTSLMIMKV